MANVLVAPVAAEVLASALTVPHLRQEVAFGTRQRDLDMAAGTRIFLYVAPDASPLKSLLRPGSVSWAGTLGRIVPACSTGPRRGMHPDAGVRPPFAERYDYRDAAVFWHVLDLAPLSAPIPFQQFRDTDGARLFGGFAPQWISRALLVDETHARSDVGILRAA